jgi:hypothetical protein
MSFNVRGVRGEESRRFRTLELTATASYDASALSQLLARDAEVHRAAGATSARLYCPPGDVTGEVGFTWRTWWAPPEHWRDDLTWPNGQTTVIIVRPDATLAYVSMQRTLYTSEPRPLGSRNRVQPAGGMHLPTIAERLAEFPLIRPHFPMSEWEITTLNSELYRGRAAQRVRVTRRPGSAATSGYWPGVDEYEYLVDDALRILVRFTGLEGGVPIATISADAVRADAPLPNEVFAFTPPVGTRIIYAQQ